MPSGLQGHIYRSLLSKSTADVALRVHSSSWTALYKLHRVVLIQAGFFQDLFTAGFSEASHSYKGHYAGPEELKITFDDLNITRAAFEVCIAHLYGGGPDLFVPDSIVPSLSQPLTPGFPSKASQSLSLAQAYAATPTGNHPATPRFLLSLLATAIFLSVPSLAVQALNSILGSVGPQTVVRYLIFSLGKPMGSMDTATFPEPHAAVGLENVGDLQPQTPSGSGNLMQRILSRDKGQPYIVLLGDDESCKEDPLESSGDEEEEACSHPQRDYHYGPVSDKIGEAAACWLARWAIDIVALETEAFNQSTSTEDDMPHAYSTQAIDIPAFSHGKRRATTISGPLSGSENAAKEIPTIWRRGCSASHNHGQAGCVLGVPADWVRAVLSSDSLFVRGERDRYDLARNVVNLRRQEYRRYHPNGENDDEEELVWTRLFEEGIYYANMSLEEVMYISQDVSVTTGEPFVSLPVLQAAHWSQSVLRHQITAKPTSSSPRPNNMATRRPSGTIRAGPSTRPTSPIVAGAMTPPSGRATPFAGSSRTTAPTSTSSGSPSSPTPSSELGVARTKQEILAGSAMDLERPHFPIPGDSSTRLGDNGGIEGKTMDQLFELSLSHTAASSTAAPVRTNQKHTAIEANYFGLLQDQWIKGHSEKSGDSPKAKASPYPPIRFGVEFWDVEALKEKSRLHSQTVFYAGSLFNVYVQVVRKKGIQLGVYLHRQSSVDPIPPASAPSYLMRGPSNERERGHTHARGPSLPPTFSASSSASHFSPSIHPPTRSTTPQSPVGASSPSTNLSTSPVFSGSGLTTIPATAPPTAPPQPFRDPRPSISAYFSISCASATGASLTKFTSAPDVFSPSQSWGWKSSSLRTEEYLDFSNEGVGGGSGQMGTANGREVSLRATVVIGLV